MFIKSNIRNEDLLYPELSYKIIGILFDVYNKMGYGYQEKYYQKAISAKLRENNLNFKEQYQVEIIFNDNKIGKYFLDFLIEDKIILEIKNVQIGKNTPVLLDNRYLLGLIQQSHYYRFLQTFGAARAGFV